MLSNARRALACPLLIAATLACSAGSSPDVQCVSAAIVGGSERAEYVALADSQEDAMARLTITGFGVPDAWCTAVVVAPRTALTAGHCVQVNEGTYTLHFELATGARAVSVAAEPHSSLDLALLTWTDEDAALDAVHAIPVDLEYRSAEGELVQIGGYGVTERGELGALSYATERITESGEEWFRVSAEHRAGACYGDSGGPALSRTSDGSVRVVGILSLGSAGCADTDRYVRLRGVGDWLAERGVVPGPALSLADCRFVGSAGRCFGGSVLSCSDGVSPRIARCEDGTRCGFDAAAGTFGCVSPAGDSCDGVSDLGSCERGNRLRCEGGAVVSSPCGACGATCRSSVRDGRAICSG